MRQNDVKSVCVLAVLNFRNLEWLSLLLNVFRDLGWPYIQNIILAF